MKEGWEIKTLGEVCENLDRMRKPVTKKDRVAGKYPYYGASGVVDYVADFIFDGDFLLVSEDGANLLARSTPIAFSISGKNWVNNHAHILKFDNPHTQNYVEYYINSIDIAAFVHGAAQPKFTQDCLNNLKIPLPPLSEQLRIVEVLDREFERIDTIRRNAETSLKYAKDLMQAKLKEELQCKEGWARISFDKAFKLKSGEYLPTKKLLQGEYPVFGGNGIMGYHNMFNLEGENIIIGRVGALCGTVRHLTENVWITDNAFRLTFLIPNSFDFEFLAYYLNFCNLRRFARQAAQPVISNSSLAAIEIFIPPLQDQQQIVARLDKVSQTCKQIEENSKAIMEHCDALKQALLRKAFEGEL